MMIILTSGTGIPLLITWNKLVKLLQNAFQKLSNLWNLLLGQWLRQQNPKYDQNFNHRSTGINPDNCLYWCKHNPFISFKTFTNSHTHCASQKDFNNLYNDLAAGNLADYIYIVPNQANDAHDTLTNYSAAWYKQFVEDLTHSPQFYTSLILVHVVYNVGKLDWHHALLPNCCH